MDKHELGAFLRARRERLRPEDVGLRTGPRRRTPGFGHEGVAVRLEQGRATRPSGDVLAGIAGADLLHVPTRTAQHDRPSIRALLERLPLTAGFVTSAVFEVLAANFLASALMEDFARLAPEERNLARRAFLSAGGDRYLYGVPDAAEFRHHVVMELRAVVARYPADPAVTGLVDELRAGSEEFARLWERHDVQFTPALTKTFHHPVVGDITVDCDSMALTGSDQHLVLYTAAGSRDADALALLSMVGGEEFSGVRGG